MFDDDSQLKKAAHLFKTLGNPYRLKIILALLDGEKNVTQINTVVVTSQPALSQHLARMRSSGILGSRRDQRQIYYYIRHPSIERLLDFATEATGTADSRALLMA